MFNTREKIETWLDSLANRISGSYKINDDLTVDIEDSIKHSNLKLKTLPVKFGKSAKNFATS